jgi:putative colanic acid biosysnthesis UDP-glucose lipid carrier transferase
MTFLLKIIFFFSDVIFLNLAIALSFYFSEGNYKISDNVNELYLILFSNIGWLFLVLVANPYSLHKGWTLSKIVKSQSVFLFIHLLIIVSLIVFFGKSYSVLQLILLYILFIPVFFVSKILVIFLRKLVMGEMPYKNYILVGRNKLSEDIRKYYLINHREGYRFKGYFNLEYDLIQLTSFKEFCYNNDIHEIYYCAENATASQLQNLVRFGLDSLIKVKLISSSSSNNPSIYIDKFDQTPGFDITILPLDSIANQIWKRIFDIFFSAIFLLTIFSWLYLIFSILIRLDSKGSVFYIQQRNGLNNKPFGCFKFRTMSFDKNAEFTQATKNDPRITRIGRFLRKSSIDELPQFINVFLGDMSLIGPRPHPIKLNEQFAPLITTLMSRHYVKPGITGLAQCMGYRGETQTLLDMENRVRLDRFYIENWSFWLDIKIIFLTIISLIRGSDKAY